MNPPIPEKIPGSFASLMSQSPTPTLKPSHKENKPNNSELPKKTLEKKESLNSKPKSSMIQVTTSSIYDGTDEGKTHVMTSCLQEGLEKVWKELIENTETHNSSLRLTVEENYSVEDTVNDLKRNLKVKTSLNELARLGLLYILHDFKLNREKSILYKVKKS